MKKVQLLLLSILWQMSLYAQDYIFMKDKTVHKCEIVEINLDTVHFLNWNSIKGGKVHHTCAKKDIIYIQYSNGYMDRLENCNTSDSLLKWISKYKADSINYSRVVIIFDFGDDGFEEFPCYFNDKFIGEFKSNTRITYTFSSTGMLVIERRTKKITGPEIHLDIQNGRFYLINIVLAHNISNPDKRYTITSFSNDSTLITLPEKNFAPNYIEKDRDFTFIEDSQNPIIK